MWWQQFKKNRIALFGLILLVFLFTFAILVPFFSKNTYYETQLALQNSPPSLQFLFGTDDLGRDILTRIALGARISLFVGISAALIDLCIGVVYGSLAALSGTTFDNVLMRIADIFQAIPYLLIVILLMVIMGAGLLPILLALTFAGWIGMARIVRGELLKLREQEYVMAAKTLGASQRRILFKHLLPNAMGPIIVTMTLTVPTAIFAEAFLSFLGLGIQAPLASLGTMASDGLPAMRYYPWRLFFPALFISLTMLGFNLVGDGLKDATDSTQKL